MAGRSPRAACEDDHLKLTVEALVLNLEQSSALALSDDEVISDLRNQLGIEQPAILNAAEVEMEMVTPFQMRMVDPQTMTEQQIAMVFSEATRNGNVAVLKKLVPEILERSEMEKTIPRDLCYSIMAQLTDDDQKTIEYFQLARQEVKRAGGNVGLLLVQELDIRLSRGMTDKLPELLQTIQRNHTHEAEVQYQLARVLGKYGLISPDGRTVSLPAAPQTEEAMSGSAIWTPDSEVPAVTAEGSSPSKIWVPGDD